MFCNSDSWDSAIVGPSERPSRPFVMYAFYFLYGPLPLFTRMSGSESLGTSPISDSRNIVSAVRLGGPANHGAGVEAENHCLLMSSKENEPHKLHVD
jgi:hypothetical protein